MTNDGTSRRTGRVRPMTKLQAVTEDLAGDLRAAIDALEAAAREKAWDSAWEAVSSVRFLAWVLEVELSGWPGDGEVAASIAASPGFPRTPAEIEKRAREELTDEEFRYFLALLDWNDEEEL